MRKLAERIRLLAIRTRVSRIGKRLDYIRDGSVRTRI